LALSHERLRLLDAELEALVASVMRAYADRVERRLVDFCESTQKAVGAPTGGLLAPRESRVSPRPDLDIVPVGHDEWLADQLSELAGRAVDIFRDRLAGQVEDAIESLEDRIDRAVQCQAQGEQAVRDRADELARVSQRIDQLAQALEAPR